MNSILVRRIGFAANNIGALSFFRREVPRLPETYNWKIPKIAGFAQSGEFGYLPNFDLKAYFKQQWEGASHDDRRRLAKVIVSDWVGVRANRPETLDGYVKAFHQTEPPTPIAGVASYSKIFAVVDPEQYAIYDARAAVRLDAVQINGGVQRVIAFNYVPGRNNVVGNTITKQGITQDVRFAPKRFVSSG